MTTWRSAIPAKHVEVDMVIALSCFYLFFCAGCRLIYIIWERSRNGNYLS